MPSRVKSYVLDLNGDRSAVQCLLNLEDGTTTQFELPIGPAASQFIGQMVEQCQFAGDHLPPPTMAARFAAGVYPTYPARTSISIMEHPTQGPTPLLVADYGGCELGFAVDAQSLQGRVEHLVRRLAEERQKRGLPPIGP